LGRKRGDLATYLSYGVISQAGETMFNTLLNPQDIAYGHHSGWRSGGLATLPAPMHRTIIYVDVEGFASPYRTNADQTAVRAGLYRALDEAFTTSGVPLRECYHEDRGDGALILVPPEVPKNILVTGIPGGLAAALHEHNRTHHRQACVRLRMAIHAGEVLGDEHGVAGTAINFTARLVDAKPLKRALRRSSDVIALIASEWFFDEVIRHHPVSVPSSYGRVRVRVKKTKANAWLRRPDMPFPQPTPRITAHADDLLTGATPASAYVREMFGSGTQAQRRGGAR
jgi:class 3 adenylate cyclase